MTVGNSSNRTLHSMCGGLSIASSLMLDSRFSTFLKCSAHLFKIASLSVRRVFPSALTNVVASELFGNTKTIQNILRVTLFNLDNG